MLSFFVQFFGSGESKTKMVENSNKYYQNSANLPFLLIIAILGLVSSFLGYFCYCCILCCCKLESKKYDKDSTPLIRKI